MALPVVQNSREKSHIAYIIFIFSFVFSFLAFPTAIELWSVDCVARAFLWQGAGVCGGARALRCFLSLWYFLHCLQCLLCSLGCAIEGVYAFLWAKKKQQLSLYFLHSVLFWKKKAKHILTTWHEVEGILMHGVPCSPESAVFFLGSFLHSSEEERETR